MRALTNGVRQTRAHLLWFTLGVPWLALAGQVQVPVPFRSEVVLIPVSVRVVRGGPPCRRPQRAGAKARHRSSGSGMRTPSSSQIARNRLTSRGSEKS